MNSNRTAFLDMLAFSEGTSTSPATRNKGYDVIVTGIDGKPEIFTDYEDHPFARGRKSKLIAIRADGTRLLSSASGRYQQMLKYWPHYRDLLKLPDFGPEAQDKLALQLIREQKAMPDIDAGRFADAVTKCCNIWASLPGAGYGQREHKLAKLQDAYIKAGGTVA